MIYKNRNMLCY